MEKVGANCDTDGGHICTTFSIEYIAKRSLEIVGHLTLYPSFCRQADDSLALRTYPTSVAVFRGFVSDAVFFLNSIDLVINENSEMPISRAVQNIRF